MKNGFKKNVVLTVSTIVDVLEKDGRTPAVDLIAAADRATLDRYAEEIAGVSPHPSHDTEKVREHLLRWADGDKNWGDDPNRVAHVKRGNKVPNPHTQAETPQEDVMTQKKEAKKTKKTKKSVPPKPATAVKAKKEGRTPTLAALGDRMPKKLFSTYKGRELEAHVKEDGHIVTSEGTFTSPSSAANAFADKTQDGWLFWKYLDAEGKRQTISGLRKK